MTEFLFSIDKALLLFLNRTLSNPLGDYLWPIITDYDKQWVVRIILASVWLWLLIRGGRRGRTVALLIVPVLVISDQLSSTVIKSLVMRPRPCHEIDGIPVVEGLRLLVNCGSGKSFPSSHAVNNFAMATVFSTYYPGGKWGFFGWATLVALSRSAVGVHYPSDIIGGALIGFALAWLVIFIWNKLSKMFEKETDTIPPSQTSQ